MSELMQNILLWVSIITPILAFFGFIYNQISNWRSETKEEIKKIEQAISAQSARTDKLYEMFIDLLKEKKDRTNP